MLLCAIRTARLRRTLLFRHLPEYLEGRTPKKNVLSTFKRNFTPAKSRKQGTFFFGVAERSEAVAERYERTIQFQTTTHAGRAISHLFGKKFAQMLELLTFTQLLCTPQSGFLEEPFEESPVFPHSSYPVSRSSLQIIHRLRTIIPQVFSLER